MKQPLMMLPEHSLSIALEEVVGTFLDDPFPHIEIVACRDRRFGDYQSSISFALAKLLKDSPLKIAERLSQPLRDILGDAYEVHPSPPGFLNFTLSQKLCTKMLGNLLDERSNLGIQPIGRSSGHPKTIYIDFSSPNIAKHMHIGHIRSIVIGDSLLRCFKALGYHVIADNHIGDWGAMFGRLLYGYNKIWDEANFERDPLGEMERVYVAVGKVCEDDPTVLEESRAYLVKLQQGDPTCIRIWSRMRALSLKEFDKIYQQLGLKFDVSVGESFYQNHCDTMLHDMQKYGLCHLSDGAQVVFFKEDDATEEEKALHDHPLIIQKRDSSYPYAMTELAALRYRIEKEAPSQILHVVDQRQALHFQQVFAAFERLRRALKDDPGAQGEAAKDDPSPPRYVHVSFGMIQLRTDKGRVRTIKTRDGDVIYLQDFINEAIDRAHQVVQQSTIVTSKEERDEVARVLGIGSIKYADLSQNRRTNIVFDWDRALSRDGNTAPYLIYTYARIQSVLDKASLQGISYKDESSWNWNISGSHERLVAFYLFRFHDALSRTVDGYAPHILCEYLHQLATHFNTLFQNVPIIRAEEKDLVLSRLSLSLLVGRVIQRGLSYLGIETVDRM